MKEHSLDLINESVELVNALSGLESFANDKFTSINNIKREDLSALQGLVKAIEIMAEFHAENIEKMFE